MQPPYLGEPKAKFQLVHQPLLLCLYKAYKQRMMESHPHFLWPSA